MTPDDYQFRKQLLSLLRYLTDKDATVLFTSQSTADQPDDDLQFLSDGIITLDSSGRRRTIQITKFRGSDFIAGQHSMAITNDGIQVYPVLPLDPPRDVTLGTPNQLGSGVPQLDQLLGGGLEEGTTTLLSGPSGVGKSTLGTAFLKEAASTGARSKLYLFEEGLHTLLNRSKAVNIPIDDMRENDVLDIEVMESVSIDSNQFGVRVREDVEEHGTDIVMIDGLEGYQHAVIDDEFLKPLHRLTRSLSNRGVSTFLTSETKDIASGFELTDHGGTYLSDNIVFLQHVEFDGEMGKVIGVLKKRMGDFERKLRAFKITEHGIRVGEPMTNLRGIITGTPEIIDENVEAQVNTQ